MRTQTEDGSVYTLFKKKSAIILLIRKAMLSCEKTTVFLETEVRLHI
jgi:hypothetical protein